MDDITNKDISPKIPSAKFSTEGTNQKNIFVLIISLVGLLLAISIIILSYLWWKNNQNVIVQKSSEDQVIEDSARGTLPSISNNPLDGKPNLNPVDNTNPINKIKTNPFE